MHVIVVTPYYPHEDDPSCGIFIHQQAVALRERGHQLEVLHVVRKLPFWRKGENHLRQRVPQASRVTLDGIPVQRVMYYCPGREFFDRWWCSIMALALRQNIRCIDGTEPKVMYAQWLIPTAAACARINHVLEIPLVAIARGYDLNKLAPRSIYLRNELDLVWRRADRILANGEWAFRDLKNLGFDPFARGVELVRNVKDLSQFLAIKSPHREGGSFNIVTVAALEIRKGIDVLLEACARILGNVNFRLVVLGDGSKRAELERQAQELGLQGHVLFRGIVSQEDIVKVLSESHLFVLSSRREGSPNALMEAMAAGLACVASAVGGIPDLIEDEVSGLLVPLENPEALAKTIGLLNASEGLRCKFGQRARSRAKALYSYEHNLERLEEVLVSVAFSKKRKDLQ